MGYFSYSHHSTHRLKIFLRQKRQLFCHISDHKIYFIYNVIVLVSQMSQYKIISLGRRLGYLSVNDTDGVCQGVTMAWLLACLAGNTPRYSSLIAEIQQDEDKIFQQVIAVKDKIEAGTKLTVEDEKIFQILSFYEQVVLYQKPNMYSELFSELYNQSHIEHISRFAVSEKIEQLDGIRALGTDTRVLTLEELKIFFAEIANSINAAVSDTELDIPIALDIRNLDHAMGIVYVPRNRSWKVLDVNRNSGDAQEFAACAIDEVALYIHNVGKRACFKYVYLTLQIKFFTTGNHPAHSDLIKELSELKNRYLISLSTSQIERASPAKLSIMAACGDLPLFEAIEALTPIPSMSPDEQLKVFLTAVFGGQIDIAVKFLTLDNVKKIFIANHSSEIVSHALKNGGYDMLQLLVQYGFNLNANVSQLGTPPIVMAVKNQAVKTVELLLAHGADCNSEQSFDRSLIFIAADNNDFQMMELLLSQPKFNFKQLSTFGGNLLHWAVDRVNPLLLKWLLETPCISAAVKKDWLEQKDSDHQLCPESYLRALAIDPMRKTPLQEIFNEYRQIEAMLQQFDNKLTLCGVKLDQFKREGQAEAAKALETLSTTLQTEKKKLLNGTIKKIDFYQHCDDAISTALSSELKNHRDFLSRLIEPLVKFFNYVTCSNFFETKSTKMLKEFKTTMDNCCDSENNKSL